MFHHCVVDFCLTYKDVVVGENKTEEGIAKSSKRRKEKREKFLENLEAKGLQFEFQEPNVCKILPLYKFLFIFSITIMKLGLLKYMLLLMHLKKVLKIS